MHRARFDTAFLVMSLSFSMGIGVTEVFHQASYIETRSEPKSPRLSEQQPVKPFVDTGSDSNCRSLDLDDLSRLYDDLIRERISLEAPRLIPTDKVKKKTTEIESKIQQLQLYLDKHRYDHYDEDWYQNLLYREKCYDF